MNSYQEFAKYLDQLLGGVHAVRIAVFGYMPLSVEEIGFSGDGDRLVSLCQYGEQTATSCVILILCSWSPTCPTAR